MSDLVGTCVELAVAQGLRFEHQCHGVRPFCGMGFELLVDRCFIRVVLARLVPLFEQLGTLFARQYRNGVQWSLRRLFQCIDQTVQGLLHIGADPCGLDQRHSLDRQQEVFALVIDVQGQRIVGAFFATQAFNALPGVQCLLVGLTGDMPVVEQGAEQRR